MSLCAKEMIEDRENNERPGFGIQGASFKSSYVRQFGILHLCFRFWHVGLNRGVKVRCVRCKFRLSLSNFIDILMLGMLGDNLELPDIVISFLIHEI